MSMVPFKEFIPILENRRQKEIRGLNDVPRDIMGVSKSALDLPNKPPFGFWVDRSGNFRAVGNMRHNTVADEMIFNANMWLKQKKLPTIKIVDRGNDPYDKFLENGWIRVVLDRTTNNVFYTPLRGNEATSKQLSFLEYVQGLYDFDRIVQKF